MKRLFQNKFMFFSVLGGVIVFAALVMFILSSGATVKAAVLNTDAKSGVTITDSMVQEIDVPAETPGDFFKSKNSLIGERLTSNVSANQLIYPGDLMSSIELVGGEQDDDYVVTSITVPDEQAIGGLLTAGDRVDVAVVPDNNMALAQALPDFDFGSNTSDGGITFILANVTILDATTSVASEQGSNLASTIEGSSSTSGASSTYLVSLSYNDYKKLRIADQYGKIFLNLSSNQNSENAPLLDQMSGGVIGGLTNAQNGEDAKGKNPVSSSSSNGSSAASSSNQNSSDNNSGNNDQNNNGDSGQ